MSQQKDHCWQTIQGLENPWEVHQKRSSKLRSQKSAELASLNNNQTTIPLNTQSVNTYDQPNYSKRQSASPNPPKQDPSSKKSYPLSKEDQDRQEIAKENIDFSSKNPTLVPPNGETIYDETHINIQRDMTRITGRKRCQIFINSHSTIWSANYCHTHNYKTIYVLNFADPLKPGGGYLNGRSAQEETLCRQTLLYPSLEHNDMYSINSKCGPEGTDVMIYSPNVLVIRDDNYKWLQEKDRFRVNVISSAAVNNREEGEVRASEEIMEKRIRRIINLAAFKAQKDERGEGKNALILGAFGCGVFKNDPSVVASIFAKVLNNENMKNFFDCVVFPIYKDRGDIKRIFDEKLLSKY